MILLALVLIVVALVVHTPLLFWLAVALALVGVALAASGRTYY